MLSQAQQTANTSNAQLSTGPRTPEGKARSSQNALQHGLNARDLVIRADESEEFQLLQASLQDDLQPQGALEQDLFGQLLHAAWNLRRVRRLEADLARGPHDRLTDNSCDRAFTRFARHHARFERSYFRCLRELRALQTNRALRAQLQPQPAAVLPALASITEMTKRTRRPPDTHPPVGHASGLPLPTMPAIPTPDPRSSASPS